MNKTVETIKKKFDKYVSPTFLVLLVLSLVMWYLIKLGYTYTAEIPVSVNLDGNKFKVTCIAEGKGYRIFAHRFFRQSPVVVSHRDVDVTQSIINNDNLVVNAFSLQNAISLKITDLTIVAVRSIPEIPMSDSDSD